MVEVPLSSICQALDNADRLISLGRLAEAKELLRHLGLVILDTDAPNGGRLAFLEGIIASKEGDFGQAFAQLTRAQATFPDDIQLITHLAKAGFALGKHEVALSALRRGMEVAPHVEWLQLALAGALRELGRKEEASLMAICDEDFSAITPVRVRIESSSACNLRCQHCTTGVSYDATDRSVMSMELFLRLLEQIKHMPLIKDCVLYLGGEPLLNKNLARMLRLLKEETRVSDTHFTTNGMLLDEDRCRELAESRVDKIFVSIDGRSPEENDRIRRGASYQTILTNVRRLRAHLADRGTLIVIANTLLRRPGDPENAETPEFLRRDFPGFPIWSYYAGKWPGLDVNSSALGLKIDRDRPSAFCPDPFLETTIRMNGDVVLCCSDVSGIHPLGNIVNDELAEIWNNPAYRAIRRAIQERNLDDLPPICRRCSVYTGERVLINM